MWRFFGTCKQYILYCVARTLPYCTNRKPADDDDDDDDDGPPSREKCANLIRHIVRRRRPFPPTFHRCVACQRVRVEGWKVVSVPFSSRVCTSRRPLKKPLPSFGEPGDAGTNIHTWWYMYTTRTLAAYCIHTMYRDIFCAEGREGFRTRETPPSRK